VPDVICCGSEIQRDSHLVLFGIACAASVERVARWVRSGPIVPRAGVPRIVWQLEQRCDRNTRSSRRCSGVTGARRGRAMFASQARKRSGGSATTVIAMFAC
jgi:hypothetical protein